MKRSEAYPSKYLSADDLGDKTVVATIASVSHEAMMDGRVKPTVYFAGKQKGVVVNKTNADCLYTLAGTDDDKDWVGVSIELYTEQTRRPDGTPCRAIRFRAPPQVRKAQVVEALDDEIPDFG